jgi:hypothetical protein
MGLQLLGAAKRGFFMVLLFFLHDITGVEAPYLGI